MSEETDLINDETRQEWTMYRWSARGRFDRWLLGMSRRAKRKYSMAGAIVGAGLGAVVGWAIWAIARGW